ncbi:TIGR01457 family HAD-type hydrolase [Paenibacillus radicis (ex Gao et al. 2016)]|uniref:Acid sugar phosphatase n=1 Tax=Paenibacillus radicis (ex Gao et al. 2016) TaxID=1737354 RepID=A0A917HSP3_9BACL|nr:TIGR01457 family HAD-type hydrolase [Paenibacillus radicis (ex Gao et al. 2016)]GGG88083.1 acid sugar phosphatase [Paenibacillus radicis (ex Gao et al. 2016)]
MKEQRQLPAMNGLLLDLDGTLYHGTRRIEGADRLIRFLKEQELPYRFVTNNSSATPEAVADRLLAMGIEATAGDVCTSAQGAAGHIAQLKPGASVFVVGEAGLRQAVEEAGLQLTEEQPDFVLQGIDRGLTYERLAVAVRHILNGAKYVLTNPDLLLPTENGLMPGAGSIGAMLKAAGGQEPILIGKPSPILMDYSLDKLGLTADQTWVVGDNLATDIAAGRASGCGTALVLTGLTTADNFESYADKAGCKPDAICANLDELISYISASTGR